MILGSPAVSAVMLPKADAESPWQAFDGKPVLALVETAAGIEASNRIARASSVQRLALGSVDLQLDLGIEGEDALLFFRSQLVLASRLGNLPPPVDGPCTDLRDSSALAAHSRRARSLGFGGQLCIHPSQVPAVNSAFLPTVEQLDWARRVVAAMAEAEGSAVALDGKMIDRPVLLRAQALLATRDDPSSR